MKDKIKENIFRLLTIVLAVYSAEILKQLTIRIEMEWYIFLLNLCIVGMIGVIVHCFVKHEWIVTIITLLLIDIFACINYYVMVFRGRPIYANDLYSIGTALKVCGEYDWTIPKIMWFLGCVHIGWCVLVFVLSRKINVQEVAFKKRVLKGIGAFVILFFISGTNILNHIGINVHYFTGDKNGLLLNFLLSVNSSIYKKPGGYSEELVESMISDTENRNIDNKTKIDDLPNIVVIMNESFSDLNIWGDVKTNEDYLKNYRDLDNCINKGYVLSSVWGGNTANSEFEFLTGNSMFFLPNGCVPYQTYINEEMASLVSYLEGYGYQTIAVHPGYSDAWNRESVYDKLGFDKISFIDDYNWEYLRNYVSDKSCYQFIKEEFEKKDNEPLFLFNVTIQNHGGYLDENYINHISIENTNNTYMQANQYLSLIQESDKALNELLQYFNELDEEVIVLFFGDHQPKLEDGLVEEIIGKVPAELGREDYDKLHYVPYFIWGNDIIDIPAREETMNYTSINYLSNYLLSAANIPNSAYNNMLESIQKEIPILSLTDMKVSNQDSELNDALLKEYEFLEYYYMKSGKSENLWKR